MAKHGGSSSHCKKVSMGFCAALTSAVLEWFLIFMLYVHAILSYLITKFAYYCELQVPCLLCSRLDHIIGKKNRGFYWDLICGDHKLEISSLVLCHVHNKLTDVHGICETCLFSFATINKSNAETYRLLVGKLGEEPDDQSHEDGTSGSTKTKHCSCCDEPWVSKGYTQKFLPTRTFSSDDDDQNHLMRKRDRSTMGVSADQFEENRSAPLSQVGYMELKINSDTETESHFSDVDTTPLIPEMPKHKQDIAIECTEIQPCIVTLGDKFVSKKMIDPAFESEPSLLLPKVYSGDINANVATSGAPNVAIGHGLEELNWQQAETKAELSGGTELISFDDIPRSPKSAETALQVTKEIFGTKGPGDCEKACFSECGGISKLETGPLTLAEMGLEIKMDTGFGSYLELGDAYKLAVSNKGRQLADKQVSMNKSPRVSEDFRILLSQLSTARGFDLAIPDISPRVYGHNDEQKRISFERNESGFESLDGSVVSEIEGESVLSRCKRQIDHDRKLLGSLYKELEEERNASSIAANQAMAMITRLQEEKAEIHMEALQYLRMMEEQSEYDMEALQKANDQLVEKEKEIQDLEAELEFYKSKSPNHVADAEKPIAVRRESKLNKSLLEFEDEKEYISNCLEKLEERIHLFSNNGAYADIGNGSLITKYERDQDGLYEKDFEQEINGSSLEEILMSENSQESVKKVKKVSSLVFGENDIVGLGNVVSDLNNRLKALEDDRDFLEIIINTLKSGDEGLDFIQEIASHLRELRRIGVRINGEDFS